MKKAIVFIIGVVLLFGACGPSREELKKEIKEELKKEAVTEAQKAAKYLNMRKYKISAMELKTATGAIESFMTLNYNAPKVTAFRDLKSELEPFYIKTLPLTDAWGNNFLYKVTGEKEDIYFVASPGSDGIFAGFDQKGKYTELKGQDIIYSCGMLAYGPEKSVFEMEPPEMMKEQVQREKERQKEIMKAMEERLKKHDE